MENLGNELEQLQGLFAIKFFLICNNLTIDFLSPTFTSGKLRAMHLKMNRCVKMLTNHLEQIASPSAVVNVKEIITGFTIDVSYKFYFLFNNKNKHTYF